MASQSETAEAERLVDALVIEVMRSSSSTVSLRNLRSDRPGEIHEAIERLARDGS